MAWHGTKEQDPLTHVRAFDELSRFTTALFSAPIILVLRRPFARLFKEKSKRRIVNVRLSLEAWLDTRQREMNTIDHEFSTMEVTEFLGKHN